MVYWYTLKGKSVPLGYAWADADGKVSLYFDTHGLEAGEYTIAAAGQTNQIQGQATLTLQ